MSKEEFIWRVFGVCSIRELSAEDDAIEEYFFDHDWSREQIFEYNHFKDDFIKKYGSICANLWSSGYFSAVSAAYFASPLAKDDLVSILMLGTFTVSSAIFARSLQERRELTDSYNQKNKSLGLTFVKKR